MQSLHSFRSCFALHAKELGFSRLNSCRRCFGQLTDQPLLSDERERENRFDMQLSVLFLNLLRSADYKFQRHWLHSCVWMGLNTIMSGVVNFNWLVSTR
jgi:hypothetical protein